MARVKKGLNGVEKNVLGNRKAREAINKGELFHKTEDLRKELKVDHGNPAKHELAVIQGQIKGKSK